jgi:nicotinate-nucleotide adenylyltransferase
MRLGILGGTFDPPHNGHLMFAEEALRQLNLDQVLFMLTPNPPHKEGNDITELQSRYEMLDAMISEYDEFIISDIEINRPPPHYTIDTVLLLRQIYPEDEIIYLMGGDSLIDLPEIWHSAQEIVDTCDGLGVFQRNGFEIDLKDIESKLPGIALKVIYLKSAQIDVSSTQIRKNTSEGEPIDTMVPVSVQEIIKKRNLYKSVK